MTLTTTTATERPEITQLRRALTPSAATALIAHTMNPDYRYFPDINTPTIACDMSSGAPVFAYLPPPVDDVNDDPDLYAAMLHAQLLDELPTVTLTSHAAIDTTTRPQIADTCWNSYTRRTRHHTRFTVDNKSLPGWQAHVTRRDHTEGGYIRIPEYAAVIECRNGWTLYFPATELVHATTPIRNTRSGGTHTVEVFYARP